MNVTSLRWHLRLGCDLNVSRPLLHHVAGRAPNAIVTFVRREHSRTRANLHLLQTRRLFHFLWWIMRGRSVHDVYPNRQGELASKCSAIDFLRLIESGPNRASEIAVVAGKERVREIVRGPSLSRGRNFF